MTELVQVDADFSYCKVGGSMLQFSSHHFSINCCENLKTYNLTLVLGTRVMAELRAGFDQLPEQVPVNPWLG